MSPTLEVVRGQASLEELAALTASLVSLQGAAVNASPQVSQSMPAWRTQLTWKNAVRSLPR